MYQANDIFSMIIRYTGETSFVVIFLLVLVYLYLNSEESYKKRIVIMFILSLVLVFNNIMFRVAGSVIGYAMYYRFLWAVPVVLVIAGAMVKIVDTERNIGRKVVLVLFMALVVSIGGSSPRVLSDAISYPTNRYHIPRDVIEVAHIINSDKEVERAVVVANSAVLINIRQYDPSFKWGVRRSAFINMHREGPENLELNDLESVIVRVVEFGRQVPEEKELFREAVEELEIDYIVALTGFNLDDYMDGVGFTVVGRTEITTVYRRVEQEPLVVHREYIHIPGIIGEYRFILFADLHLSLVGEDDPVEKQEYAEQRGLHWARYGPQSFEQLPRIVRLANRLEADAVLLAGDILDNPSQTNVDYLYEGLSRLNMPFVMALGNHDFTVPWEYYTEKSFEVFLPRLNPLIADNPNYPVKRWDDFILLTVDNSGNQIMSREYVEILESVVAEGKPVIIQMHVPLIMTGNDDLLEKSNELWPSETGLSRVLVGEYGIRPNELTEEFLEIIFSENSPVVAVLAGHAHFHSRDLLNEQVIQIIAPPAYRGEVIEVMITGD